VYQTSQLVKIRFFAGLTVPEAAGALGLPQRAAEPNWACTRAWPHREVSRADPTTQD
jgi:hypothetical protein